MATKRWVVSVRYVMEDTFKVSARTKAEAIEEAQGMVGGDAEEEANMTSEVIRYYRHTARAE